MRQEGGYESAMLTQRLSRNRLSFIGLLFTGIMVTTEGPKTIEYVSHIFLLLAISGIRTICS